MINRLIRFMSDPVRRAIVRRKTVLPYMPGRITMEPTNNCNLRCIMCPRSFIEVENTGYMDIGLLEKFLAGLDWIPDRIGFWYSGEPLLHKDIKKILLMVKEKGIKTEIFTNCSLLSPDKINELFEANLDSIVMSLDGVTRENYEKMRRGASYEKTIGNMLSLLREKKARASMKPRVTIRVLRLWNSSAQLFEDTSEFKNLFEGLPVDEFNFRVADNWCGQLGENEMFRPEPSGGLRYPCPVPFSETTITYNGDVVTCVGDWKRDKPLGSIKTSSLREIWNGPEYQALRSRMFKGNLEDFYPCCECPSVFMKNLSVSKIIKYLLYRIHF